MIEIFDSHHDGQDVVGKDADGSEWMLVDEPRDPGPFDNFCCCECGGLIGQGAWICYLDKILPERLLMVIPRAVCHEHVTVLRRSDHN